MTPCSVYLACMSFGEMDLDLTRLRLGFEWAILESRQACFAPAPAVAVAKKTALLRCLNNGVRATIYAAQIVKCSKAAMRAAAQRPRKTRAG